jgi:intracellular multiplication protein IcmJ
MLELQLAVNLNGWRIFVRRKEDRGFLPVTNKILDRDHHTCQYCGFQARRYQEVVNLDGNYSNNKFNNLVTACCFCTQCLFIESAGMDEMGGGQIIFMPEMNQANLNSFCHVLFCAMGNGTGYQDTAQAIYRSLKFRSQPVESKFGPGTSNPSALGHLLLEYQDKFPGKKQQILKDLRMLPSYNKFKVQLDGWAEDALEELAAEAKANEQREGQG